MKPDKLHSLPAICLPEFLWHSSTACITFLFHARLASRAFFLSSNDRISSRHCPPVNRLEKGKYQIVQTGQILQSSAADAP
jgi:hypothetical protein